MIAATLVAAILRLWHLGTQSLWIDEIFTWSSAAPGAPLRLGDLLENVHGPLYSLLTHVAIRWLGSSEWALRLPSALASIAMVPAMAALAHRWLGREVAVPAAWLAACSPFLVWYGQEARNYSLLMLCVCVAGALVLDLARRPTPGRAMSWLAAALAGLLSNLSFAFVLPLHLRWWLGGPDLRGRRAAIALAALLALPLLTAPWLWQAARIWDWHRLHPGRAVASSEERLRGATTFHPGAVPFALHAFAVGYTLGPSLREMHVAPPSTSLGRHAPGLAVVAAVFGVLGVLGARALRRRGRLGEALLWLLPAVLAVSWFAASNFKVFHPRYLAAVFPAFLLWMAAALADLKGWRRGLLGAALAGLWALSLAHHYFDPRYGKEDFRGATRLVRERGAAGEKILAVNTQDPLFYYYRGPLVVEPFWLGFASPPARLESKLDQAFSGVPGVWVVLSRPEDLDPSGAFARRLEERYPAAERFRFEGVRVWHVRGGAGGS